MKQRRRSKAMLQFEFCEEIRDHILKQRGLDKTIGLVPTMGALHRGHLSLVTQSVRQCDETVVTIFVNPNQFGPSEDLDKYPRTLTADLAAIQDAGASIVFVPTSDEMYPAGFSTHIDPPAVADSLEGVFRPGHFRGVTTIVLKLFTAIPATDAFFGLKDYQQFQVIQAMTQDLNLGIRLHGCETVREPDGLAMSSRNRYLSVKDRKRAIALSAALQIAQDALAVGNDDPASMMALMADRLKEVDKVDYAAIVDAETLQPVKKITAPVVALIAAHVGDTRLIDNRILTKVA